MNIINLRNVGSYEIPDSYCGILRISPNDGMDDPSQLFLDLKEIELSDSEGNKLPLTFVPKVFSTVVIDRKSDKDTGKIDMIHVCHEYEKLFVSKSLNIRSNLYINTPDNKVPLIFSDSINSVGYPIESPCDIHYFNNKNEYEFSADDSYEVNLSKKIPPGHALYKPENSDQWIKINGQYLHTYIKNEKGKDEESYIKLPLLKRRDYALGHTPGQRYKKESSSETIHDLIDDSITSSSHTQLSFIPLESLIYSTIERLCRGLYRAPITGRYYGLYPTDFTFGADSGDDLGEKLFGKRTDNLESELSKVAPILATPVQSGTIHYNAIHPHNYFFHLIRHYNKSDVENDTGNDTKSDTKNDPENYLETYLENNSNTITFAPEKPTKMAALTKQYVLCDGKDIKTGYPNIDKKAFENNYGNIHKAIAKSLLDEKPENDSNDSTWEPLLADSGTGSTGSETTSKYETFKTPPLFEFDQLSLRFLRGLNWVRYYNRRDTDNNKIECYYLNDTVIEKEEKTDENTIHFKDNTCPYEKVEEGITNIANNIKDIHEVGMYYANTDISLQKEPKHFHLLFTAPQNEVNDKKLDDLKNERKMFVGSQNSELPKNAALWKDYVNIDKNTSSTNKSFLGTKILKTAGSILLNQDITKYKERLRKLQNYPISLEGGANTQMHEIAQCVRYGKHQFILVGVKCMNHRTSCQEFFIRDGYYYFASHSINDPTKSEDDSAATSMKNSSWRLVSSLPRGNKYGKINVFDTNFSEAKFIKKTNEELSLKIDDSLCSPTSNNLIPLMKI